VEQWELNAQIKSLEYLTDAPDLLV
jgi:hypothetical protein